MFNWGRYLRRAIVAVILLGVVLYHPAGLMRLLERALSAPPYQQAAGIIFVAVIVLLGSIFWNCAAMVMGDDGPPVASIPLGGRLGDITTSDLERWAGIHKHEGEPRKPSSGWSHSGASASSAKTSPSRSGAATKPPTPSSPTSWVGPSCPPTSGTEAT